uniref:Ski_Sno domain-containing protein n=1 Tax=Macrostomum lignano TaxID=282301 RepID=A0A1I8J9B5_9PLAT
NHEFQNLPDQLVSIRCSLRGHVIESIPFSSPAVLSQVSTLIRQQFVLNQLLASCLQLTTHRANLEPGVTCFELEVLGPTDCRVAIMRGLGFKMHSLHLRSPDCSPACRRLKPPSSASADSAKPEIGDSGAGTAEPSAQFLGRALRTSGLSLPLAVRRLQRLRGRPRGCQRRRRLIDSPSAPQSLRRVASTSALAAIASGLVEVKGVVASVAASAASLLPARPRFCLEAPAPRPKRQPLGPPAPVEFQPPPPPMPMPPNFAGGHHPLQQPQFGPQFSRQLSHPAGADGGGHHHPLPHHHMPQFQHPQGYMPGHQQHQLYQQQLVGGQATPPHHLCRQGPPHLAGYHPHQRMPHGHGYPPPPPHSQTPPYGVQFRPGAQPGGPYYQGPPSQQQQQQQPPPHHSPSPYHSQFAGPPGYGPQPATPAGYAQQMPPASPHHLMLGSPAPHLQQPQTPQPHTPHTPQPLHHPPSTPAASNMEISGPGTPLDQQLMSHHLGDSSGGSGSGFPPHTPMDKSNQNPVLISLLQEDSTSCGTPVPAQQMPMQHHGQQQHRQMFPHGAPPPAYGQQQQAVYSRNPAAGQRALPPQPQMTSPQHQQQQQQLLDPAASSSSVGGAGVRAGNSGGAKKPRKPRRREQQQQSLRLTIPKTKLGPQDHQAQKNPESVYDFDPAKEEATKASSVEARNKPLKVTIRMNPASSAAATAEASSGNNGRAMSAGLNPASAAGSAMPAAGPGAAIYGPPAAKKSRLHADKAKKSKKHRRLDASVDSAHLSTPSSSAGASPATPADASSAASAPASGSRQSSALKSYKIPRKNTASEDAASSALQQQQQQQPPPPPQQQPPPHPLPPRFQQAASFAPAGGIRQQLYQQRHPAYPAP